MDVLLTTARVARVIDQILLVRGAAERIRLDHGPEFSSANCVAWCPSRNILFEQTQPGKPMLNAFIRRFNGVYRHGVLDAWSFLSLTQVHKETERWLIEYNTVRPHGSLGDVSLIEFLTDRGHAEIASNWWS
jgi:putative transposase